MHLKPDDLMTLERYARERKAFRDRVIAHKKLRNVAVGPHLTWLFEDRLTIQYQVQEILRTERIFEPEGIVDELEAYNPLIPDGTNFKVTLLIEFPDPVIRAAELKRLKGIEDRCYVRVAVSRRYTPSPTRTSSARTRRRPPRYISCASRSRPRHGPRCATGRRSPSAPTIPCTRTR